MEISQNELVQALERAHEHGMSTAQSLADFVMGYRAALNGGEPVVGDSTPVNAEPFGAFPDRMTTHEDVALPWPDGTLAVDTDGDGYVVYKGAWIWDTWRSGNPRMEPEDFDNYLRGSEGQGSATTLRSSLPADIISIGKENN